MKLSQINRVFLSGVCITVATLIVGSAAGNGGKTLSDVDGLSTGGSPSTGGAPSSDLKGSGGPNDQLDRDSYAVSDAEETATGGRGALGSGGTVGTGGILAHH